MTKAKAETTGQTTRQRSKRTGSPEFRRGCGASRTAGILALRSPSEAVPGAPACSCTTPPRHSPPHRGRANSLADRPRFAYALVCCFDLATGHFDGQLSRVFEGLNSFTPQFDEAWFAVSGTVSQTVRNEIDLLNLALRTEHPNRWIGDPIRLISDQGSY